MATQEEVLEVIKQKGFADLKELKKHFGISGSGSSWLPQRLRSLERKKLIIPLRSGNISIYIANDFDCDWEEAKRIMLELGLVSKRPRGRPRGSYEYREESILKLISTVKEHKIISIHGLQRELKWNWNTVCKYVDKLVKDGLLFEIRTRGLRLLTTSLL